MLCALLGVLCLPSRRGTDSQHKGDSFTLAFFTAGVSHQNIQMATPMELFIKEGTGIALAKMQSVLQKFNQQISMH